MITNKHIGKIVCVIVAVAVVLCFLAIAFSGKLKERAESAGVSMEYETRLFDTSSPIKVNISMDEADWESMLKNASAETYSSCDVEIDGQTFYEVGIRPKGNTSLSSIASNPDTDRYSFKLEFDKFVKDQTCYGLDKLVLNNNYADATNMKEALIYDMYHYIGADAALYNYASIYVNGEYWGVYLALEAVEDSFLLRNYGADDGELYKPDSMDMGGKGGEAPGKSEGAGESEPPAMPGGGRENQRPQMPGGDGARGGPEGAGENEPPAMPEGADENQRPEMPGGDGARGGFGGAGENERPEMPGGDGAHGGPGGSGSNGANLNYIDDELDSYSDIWDGEVTKSKKADHKRVVEALKNISQGTDLEKYMDIDNLLRYMAVHVFSVNNDSLTGTMAHNYYLYENDGRLNMIPWDYNLSFGGMGRGSDASSTINDAIDGAFSGTEFFDTLMENEDYRNQYHAYLEQLVDEYVNGGGFDEFYTRTRGILDELVENDPTAFYTFEEYSDAAETLYQVVKLRGRSISGQLDGTIPSTESGQRQDSSALIDTKDIDLSIMGTMDMDNGDMGGGGGFKGFGGRFKFDDNVKE